MAKFRHKIRSGSGPKFIRAEQFTGQRCPNLPTGVCDCGRTLQGIPGGCQAHVHPLGTKRVDLEVGDWVVAQDRTHFYIIKPDVFAAIYEPFE